MLIGIVGRAGSGKDEAGKALQELGYVGVSFADPVREMALAINPIIRFSWWQLRYIRLREIVEKIGWDRAKREFKEIRGILQRVGTDGVRDIIGDRTWIDLALRKCSVIEKAVIRDVRFINEGFEIQRAGGFLIRIQRRDNLYSIDQMHPSEAEIEFVQVNMHINNDGTLEEFHENIRIAVKYLENKERLRK